jgi:hypothetical protein
MLQGCVFSHDMGCPKGIFAADWRDDVINYTWYGLGLFGQGTYATCGKDDCSIKEIRNASVCPIICGLVHSIYLHILCVLAYTVCTCIYCVFLHILCVVLWLISYVLLYCVSIIVLFTFYCIVFTFYCIVYVLLYCVNVLLYCVYVLLYSVSIIVLFTFYCIVFTFHCIVYVILYCLSFIVLCKYYCIVLLHRFVCTRVRRLPSGANPNAVNNNILY